MRVTANEGARTTYLNARAGYARRRKPNVAFASAASAGSEWHAYAGSQTRAPLRSSSHEIDGMMRCSRLTVDRPPDCGLRYCNGPENFREGRLPLDAAASGEFRPYPGGRPPTVLIVSERVSARRAAFVEPLLAGGWADRRGSRQVASRSVGGPAGVGWAPPRSGRGRDPGPGHVEPKRWGIAAPRSGRVVLDTSPRRSGVSTRRWASTATRCGSRFPHQCARPEPNVSRPWPQAGGGFDPV